MAQLAKFIRKSTVVGLAAATLSWPILGGVASAAPAGQAAPTAVVQAPALSPAAKGRLARLRSTVCVNAHVQNIGWQGWRCSRDGRPVLVGTTGQSLRLEALSISTRRTGGVCAQAHVQNIGWQPTRCSGNDDSVTVGTVGRSLRLEALRLSTRTGVCAQAHVENVGWQNWKCGRPRSSVTVGTVGQSLRMEALKVRV